MSKAAKDKSLLIIDGYGFVFRAYHVQPPLTSPEGMPVGAIYGFTSMLLKVINDFKPEYAVVVLDSKGKNFRHNLFKEYKANRPPAPQDLIAQLEIVRSAAEALNFLVIEKEGFEADDIIATLASDCGRNDQEAIVISSDKDLLQLMNSKIKIYDPVKSKFISETDVLAKFGVLPNKVREVQALMGDSSDNVPGIKGIGPKTAAELINNFDSLEGVYASIDKIKNPRQRELLSTYKNEAFLSWQLVGLSFEVEVPKELYHFKWSNPSEEKIVNFINKYGFKSLYKRVENLFGINANSAGNGLTAQVNVANELTINSSDERTRIIVNSSKILDGLVANIEKYGVIGVAFEVKDKIIDIAISVGGISYIVSYRSSNILDNAVPLDLLNYAKKEEIILCYNDFIDKLFADPAVKKIAINLKQF